MAQANFLNIGIPRGIMEHSRYFASEEGVPRGGVLSPILANIYLHYILDLWFAKVVNRRVKGYAGMVRYADAFVVCFSDSKRSEEEVKWEI